MKIKFSRSLLSIIAKIARIVFEGVGEFWDLVSDWSPDLRRDSLVVLWAGAGSALEEW
jgi:hypothetical protein